MEVGIGGCDLLGSRPSEQDAQGCQDFLLGLLAILHPLVLVRVIAICRPERDIRTQSAVLSYSRLRANIRPIHECGGMPPLHRLGGPK